MAKEYIVWGQSGNKAPFRNEPLGYVKAQNKKTANKILAKKGSVLYSKKGRTYERYTLIKV